MPYNMLRNVALIALVLISLQLPQVYSQDIHSNTPLMEAAVRGDMAGVKRLVELQRVNVNQTNAYGLNALYFAAGATPTRPIEKGVAGSTEVLRYLLAHGASANAKSNRNGMNALMAAADNKRPDRVTLLLASGADPNATSSYGDTPLMFAILRHDMESAKLLLAAGARVSSTEINGDSLLLAAVKTEDAAIVKMILAGHPNLNASSRNSETALTNAIMNGKNEIAQLLLNSGADPNARSHNLGGATPLMTAAQNGNAELIKTLLEKNADVTLKDDFGKTASSFARQYGHWMLWWEIMSASNK